VARCGLGASGSALEPVVGSHEHCNEPSISIKGEGEGEGEGAS
jgi:hypothetical protein